jgi:DNA repair protein RecN (Recombination protein N)
MLATLRIKNLALVADLTLELEPGYSTLTGETGAGKSILLGALSLVLGQRADRTLIRAGADACTVEAVFDVGALTRPLAPWLDAHGLEPCEDGRLNLKRTFTAAGANRQFINGSPTTLQTLSELGDWLVDIHGPHEHQSLLHPARQLELLDAYAGLSPQRATFAALAQRQRDLHQRKSNLIVDDATHARQLELLRHQVSEIEAARLQPEDDTHLAQQHQRASNAARLLELSQQTLNLISDDDTSLLSHLGAVGRLLQELHRLDPQTNPLAELHTQTTTSLRELQDALRHYADRIDLDPDHLRTLEERLNLVQSLRRKYGPTLADVLAFGETARSQLRQLENRDAELAALQAALDQVNRDLLQAGNTLTQKRHRALGPFSQAVRTELNALGFRRSHFEVALSTHSPDPITPEPPPTGFDSVEYQFAPNPGEPARPLRAIASSGELARVMLALKTVLAEQDDVLLLVFDEVDANVGGETAHAVGRKMCLLGERRQVLCITHLAPVAAAAPHHYVVDKTVTGDRTVTEVRRLSPADRVTELARMLGGQTEAARRHARELLASLSRRPAS